MRRLYRTGKEKVQTMYIPDSTNRSSTWKHASAWKTCKTFSAFCLFLLILDIFSHHSSSRTMRDMENILPQYYATFNGLHSFVHLRAPRGSQQMTHFRPLYVCFSARCQLQWRFLAKILLEWHLCAAPCAFILSPCLPSAMELPGRHVYVTQWDYRSTQNIFLVMASSSPAFAGQVVWQHFSSVLHCCLLHSARNRNSVVCH